MQKQDRQIRMDPYKRERIHFEQELEEEDQESFYLFPNDTNGKESNPERNQEALSTS